MLGNRRIKPVGADDDAPCVSCGYNLLGIADAGTCPECGALAGIARLGTLLPMAGDSSLKSLRAGAWMICLATLGVVGLPFVSIVVGVLLPSLFVGGAASPRAEEIAGAVFAVLLSALMVGTVVLWSLGWMRVSKACADEHLAATGVLARRGATLSALGFMVGVLAVFAVVGLQALEWIDWMSSASEFAVMAIVIALGIGWCTTAVLGLLLVRAVLVRTAAKAARRRVTGLLWTSPVLALSGMSLIGTFSSAGAMMLPMGFGCVSILSWLWLVFLASLMLLVWGEARLARRVCASHADLIEKCLAAREEGRNRPNGVRGDS